jgi:simple sugar transport system permease protein
MADVLGLFPAFVSGTLRAATPLLFASTGGVLSERGGIVNIALEGFLLAGAFASVAAAGLPGGPLAGLAAAALTGAALAAIHALVTIRFKVDQIVSGVALNLLAVGATRFLLQLQFHSASNSGRVEAAGMPEWLGSWPLVLLAILTPTAAHFLLEATPFGLRLRAVGDHPQAAATAGVGVSWVRAVGVLLSGALAGLGGAWLAFDQHQFVAEMSGGRGFIALAAVIFGGWRPRPAAIACLLFGGLDAFQVELQTHDVLPREWGNLVQMVPYVAVIAILAGAAGRTRAPAALGRADDAA